MKLIRTIALCVVLFFSLIYVKVFLSSRYEFKEASIADAKGNIRDAIMHYERAILWYLPVGGYVERSAERLWEIGRDLEETDMKLALIAYRSLRSAFYATRSFYTPGRSWIDRTDEKIADLMALAPPSSEKSKKMSQAERRDEALTILKRPMRPYVGWSILLEIGFWGWITGTLLFIFRAFNTEHQWNMRRGVFWGGIAIFFYALWIIGMMKA
ncbi:MAG: hypothetical protein ABGX83_07520 [Nitrospira sp.]|nr:hypothetical protein [Candidatus Manganitrophaceae bacterium]HIL35439.1 hypothetical protein [Candidatus Manganitrophaceae bacterium]